MSTATAPVAAAATASTTSFKQKFLSFLKASEQDVAKVILGAARVEPILAEGAKLAATAAGHPEIGAAIEKIGSVVVGSGALVSAVQGAQGTGVDKLAVATPLVDNLIKNSGFFGTRVVADADKWAAAVEKMTSAVADMYDASAAKPAPAAPAGS